MQRLREETRDEHAAMEPRLHAFTEWPQLDLDLPARSKLTHLDDDLRDLGCPDPTTLPHASELPTLDTIDDVLGCMYVLEGATPGGS